MFVTNPPEPLYLANMLMGVLSMCGFRETNPKYPASYGVDQVRHPSQNSFDSLEHPPKPGGGYPAGGFPGGEEPPPYNNSPYNSMNRNVPYHPDPLYDDVSSFLNIIHWKSVPINVGDIRILISHFTVCVRYIRMINLSNVHFPYSLEREMKKTYNMQI